jgi:hypothetical protein
MNIFLRAFLLFAVTACSGTLANANRVAFGDVFEVTHSKLKSHSSAGIRELVACLTAHYCKGVDIPYLSYIVDEQVNANLALPFDCVGSESALPFEAEIGFAFDRTNRLREIEIYFPDADELIGGKSPRARLIEFYNSRHGKPSYSNKVMNKGKYSIHATRWKVKPDFEITMSADLDPNDKRLNINCRKGAARKD